MPKTNMEQYYGDVEVTVRMRYRLDAELPVSPATGLPSKAAVLQCLQNREYNDITDEEELEVLSVQEVGENSASELDEEETDE